MQGVVAGGRAGIGGRRLALNPCSSSLGKEFVPPTPRRGPSPLRASCTQEPPTVPSALDLTFALTCLCFSKSPWGFGAPGGSGVVSVSPWKWCLQTPGIQAPFLRGSTCSPSVRASPLLCPRQVDLYGFGADSKGNWHHYWENNPSAGAFRKTGVHDGDFESNVTTILASINKIRIFKGR